MKNKCSNGECHVLYVSVNKKIHTYEGSVSGKNPWGKLILIVSDVTGSFASMRITFLVRSRGQKKFKCSDGVYFFGKSLKLMIYVMNQLFSL